MRSHLANALSMDPLLPLNPGWQRWSAHRPEAGKDVVQARFILNRLFQDYRGSFAISLWHGSMLYIGAGEPAFTFCIEHASVLRNMLLFRHPGRLLQAYVDGDIQILGDFHAALQAQAYFESLLLPWPEKLGLLMRALTLASRLEDGGEIHASFAAASAQHRASPLTLAINPVAPDAFYQCWLDEHMLHSCAYFTHQRDGLAQAQHKQLDLICLKLRLQHGDKLLDIGCGWGGLACWAARHYGVFVHGITQNPAQYAYAVKQVQRQGLAHLVQIELGDYRDLPALGQYDKASCIGIAEHVGGEQLPAHLEKVHGLLKPGGLFLSHGITLEHPVTSLDDATTFIHHYLFPEGALTTFPQLLQQMDSAHFDVFNIEGLRQHYVKTLRQWLTGLEAHHHAVTAGVGERTYRLWRLYMTASALQFEQGVTGMHQILATRQ